jgi:hypothetical protein
MDWTGNILTSCKTVSFSRRTLFHAVSNDFLWCKFGPSLIGTISLRNSFVIFEHKQLIAK